MNKFKYILIAIFICGLVSAQEKLKVEDVIKIALENNYTVKVANKNSEIARNNVHPGNAGLLPRVDLTADYTHTDSKNKTAAGTATTINSITSAGVTASYTLFNGMINFNTYSRLKSQGELGTLQNKAIIENTILTVIQSFYNLALYKENLLISEQSLEISQKRYDRVLNKTKYGSANKIELLNAKVDLSSDSVNYFNTKLQYSDAKRNLAVLLNMTEDNLSEIDDEVIFELTPNFDELKSNTKKLNTDLQIAREETRIADLDKSIAGAGYLPTLDLTASYGYNQMESNWGLGLDDPNSSFTARLSLKYNLFNGTQTSIKNQNAQISLENKKLLLEDSKNKVERDLANAFNAYKNNLFVMDVQGRNLKTAELNFKRTEDLFKLGQTNTIQFREAQLNLVRAKTSYSSAKYNAKLAEMKLLKISGNLIK